MLEMSRIACLLAVAGVASAQLTLDGVKCGQFTCRLDEYCSSEINRCAACSDICNKTHNYDAGLCIKECQGYILDLRYMRKSDGAPAGGDLSSIQRQAQTALIVSVVSLAVMLLILFIICKGRVSWRCIKQKFQPAKNRVKQYPGSDLTHHNPHAEMPKTRPPDHLKLDIRNPEPPKRTTQPLNVKDLETQTSKTEKSQGATTPKTMSTAISNRHPAEDTTLDFSYDNMAMNVTPPEQPAASHKF